MRDITAVIDAVLREIPDDDTTMEVRLFLRGVRRRATDSAPEAVAALWHEANELLVDNSAIDDETWYRTVIDIWSGRHQEAPGLTFTVKQSGESPDVWNVFSENGFAVTRFYGDSAEARAKEYAAWKNGATT